MEKLLFRNVICKGYLHKKETKYVYHSTIDDEYIEDDVSITLNQGGSCKQEIYKFIEKEFEGMCIGIFTIKTKREYVDCVNDTGGEQFIHTELKEPIQVAKVFYSNNKSRLVPLDKVEICRIFFAIKFL